MIQLSLLPVFYAIFRKIFSLFVVNIATANDKHRHLHELANSSRIGNNTKILLLLKFETGTESFCEMATQTLREYVVDYLFCESYSCLLGDVLRINKPILSFIFLVF